MLCSCAWGSFWSKYYLTKCAAHVINLPQPKVTFDEVVNFLIKKENSLI